MTEGIFPKTDGEILYASEVNYPKKIMQISNGVGRMSVNTESTMNITPANIFVNSFEADTALTSTNLTYRDLAGNGEYTKKTTGTYTLETQKIVTDSAVTWGVAGFDYEVFEIIDECDNSSIDATTWPTSTSFSEDTNGIYSSTNAAHLLSKDLSSYKILNFAFKLDASYGNNTSTAIIKFTDGSSNSQLIDSYAKVQTSPTVYRTYNAIGECTVFLNWSDKKAFVTISYFRSEFGGWGGSDPSYVKDNGAQFVKNYYIDLTGWTSFKIDLAITVGGSNTATGRIYYLRSKKVAPTTDASSYFSSDNGSNYVQTYGLSPVMASTTSTTLKGKLTGTVASNEVIAIKRSTLGFLV